MDKVEITIIGAGAVGLAIAANLSEAGKNCLVLEKNYKFGQETSSRNSEVIHSGIYYPRNSLKATLCVRGNNLLYEYCAKHNINHKKTSKIIVASTDEEIKDIEKLIINGKNNDVKGLELLDESQVARLEPNVKSTGAIFLPNTGILDTHTLMQKLLLQSQENGTMVSYNSNVTGISKTNDGYLVSVNSGEYEFVSEIIINSAGLNSDKIAAMAGIDIEAAKYHIFPCKGSYFRTSQQLAIQRLVYPVPSHNVHNLGIHLTIDLSGGVRFGPDAKYTDTLDYSVDENTKTLFYESVKKYIPSIKFDLMYADTSGIRPKTQGPTDGFRDFIIKEESSNSLPGFVNLIGIESPGLTSCLAIAEMVNGLLY